MCTPAVSAAVGRLAGLKQLGCCYKVFPEANHNRYQHSRGGAATSYTSTAHRRRTQPAPHCGSRNREGSCPTSKTAPQSSRPATYEACPDLSFLLVHHYLVTPRTPHASPAAGTHITCRRRLPVRPLGSPPCQTAAARGRWPAPPAHAAEPPGARTHRAGRAVPRLWSRALLTRFRGLCRQEPWDLWLVSTPACLSGCTRLAAGCGVEQCRRRHVLLATAFSIAEGCTPHPAAPAPCCCPQSCALLRRAVQLAG